MPIMWGTAGLLPLLEGPVWGPAHEALPVPVTPCSGGQSLRWKGLDFEVLDVPGHTAGHVAYFLPGTPPKPRCSSAATPCSPPDAAGSSKARPPRWWTRCPALPLPGTTRICCAHEYTLSNLKFALQVEPDNGELQRFAGHCQSLRAQGLPTLPTTLSVERAINPFLRCTQPGVVASVRSQTLPSTTRFPSLPPCAAGRTPTDEKSPQLRGRAGRPSIRMRDNDLEPREQLPIGRPERQRRSAAAAG
jgi:hydroxyacylglutathione hydrolase